VGRTEKCVDVQEEHMSLYEDTVKILVREQEEHIRRELETWRRNMALDQEELRQRVRAVVGIYFIHVSTPETPGDLPRVETDGFLFRLGGERGRQHLVASMTRQLCKEECLAVVTCRREFLDFVARHIQQGHKPQGDINVQD
jgi:chorismate mutase